MRILVVSAIWPHGEHSMRAANIVISEMILALSRQFNIKVGLLIAGNGAAVEIGKSEEKGIDALKHAGVDVLEPIVLARSYTKRPLWQRILLPKITDWYPACADGALLAHAAKTWQADVILVPWSEWLTHACSEIPVVKFAYYGNPDPKATRTQLNLRRRIGEITFMRLCIEKILVNRFERIHLQIMNKYELLGNVAKNDAEYYSGKGHRNAFYIQNIWMKPLVEFERSNESEARPIKITGSLGKLGGTANTLGLEYLGNEVLPALDNVLKGRPYEVHILGSGKPHKISANALKHPSVVWRGFVEDIDKEIQHCDVFLCVNNATEYKVGHTRYLHAWSLSAPVVAHRDASLSMPEIRHNVNALLGGSGIEIAQQIGNLVMDRKLCERIRENGLKTFNGEFTADRVASTIVSKLYEYMESKTQLAMS
ncbi:GT4_CapM-like domain containing protein [Oxalobacteraceae bacterium]